MRPRKPQIPKPPLPDPSPEDIEATKALEKIWTQVARNVFQNPHRRSLFKTEEPWKSSDKKQQYRWKGFQKLAGILREKGIPPEHFCTAVLTKYQEMWDKGYSTHMPNPFTVSGEWGFKLYREWKAVRETREAGDLITQMEVRRATVSNDDHLRGTIQVAYENCAYMGVDSANPLAWGVEVAWVLASTEPEARIVIIDQLQDLAQSDPEEHALWCRGFQKIKNSPALQAKLLRLRNEAIPEPPGRMLSYEQWIEKKHERERAQQTLQRRSC